MILRAPRTFEQGFASIRKELDVPDHFSPAVLDEAASAVDAVDDGARTDARHLPLVAIDPPGATDLDQAFAAERRDNGYRVWYAIADVGAFLRPGGAVDTEARKRGTTLYSPDGRAPLHPPVLSEDRASLLADTDKPCLLWTIDLDGDGAPTSWHLQRALVRTRAAISYVAAQAHIDRGSEPAGTTPNHNLTLLAEIGRLRQQQERKRGGISINLPAQEIVERGGSYALDYDLSIPVEGWNAQISLLTGIVAARTMVEAGVGILRTLPPPYERAVRQLRHTAQALGLDWPQDMPYADFIRQLAPNSPSANAFLLQSTRTLRGAGYLGFNGECPEHPEHGAIASVYAHVTAPLRRLVDRFGNEILLALLAGDEPPSWAVEALDELPSLMGRARQRESALERSMVDFAEAIVLEPHIGEIFTGHVVDVDAKRGRASVQIAEPAVVAPVEADGRQLAEEVALRLKGVDLAKRTVTFDVVD
ncbi:MAG: RNB domain-containing ribonuclease [Actinomycetia bacterium]|nr:RNB domain-containing ribonuclease [Actinomycetes bacterium]